MCVKVTTLIENKHGEHLDLINEHGISFYIEKDGNNYLFDTGKSSAFIHNAFKLGLDPFDIDKIVLSHGHYDHSGGVSSFLEEGKGCKDVEIVVQEKFFEKKYAVNGAQSEFLGNDFTEDDVSSARCTMRYINKDLEKIAEGIYVIGNFIRNNTEEVIKPRFRLLKECELVQDNFDDEIMLALESPKGWILIVGCAHPGIMNMINTFKERLGGELYAVLGGTHLVEANDSCLASTVRYFKELECGVLGVSHCTGAAAEKMLADDPRFFHNSAGSSIIVS